jgi:ferrous iron transport protein A
MVLSKAKKHVTYTIQAIETSDEGMKDFLFSLGCHEGQSITIISHLGSNLVVNINDARYSIDLELAKAIIV